MKAFQVLGFLILTILGTIAQDLTKGGLLITEVQPTKSEPNLFFTAEAQATARLSRKQIQQEIHLTIQVLQGTPKVVTLALHGEGEVVAVTGDHVDFWAVRQGAGDQVGQRYLEIRPKLESPDTPLTSFNALVEAQQTLKALPIETTLLTLGPGEAVGYTGRLDLSPDETISSRVVTREGWIVVALQDPNERLERLQTSGSNKLQLMLEPRGTDAQAVSFDQVKLRGQWNEATESLSFNLTGRVTVRDKDHAQLRVLAGPVALHELPAQAPYRVQLITNPGETPYYQLRFQDIGEHPIALTFETPAHKNQHGHHFGFQVPGGAIAPITLTGMPSDITFDGTNPVYPTKSDEGWLGFLPPSGQCQAAWTVSRDDSEGKLFFSTSDETEISVSAGLLRQASTLQLNVLQGKLSALAISMVGDGEILAVEGPNVLGWEVSDAGDGQRLLTIPVSRPFEGKSQLVIRSQTPIAEFPVRVSPIRLAPQGTVRHSASLRVGNQGAVRVELGSIQGMTQLSPNQYPGQITLTQEANQVFVYRIPSATYAYEILADQIMPEVSVSQITIYEMGDTDRTMDATFEIDIREAPLREWEFLIPEDYAVVSVLGAEVIDHVVGAQPANGSKPLKVLFGNMITGRHVVNVRLEKNEPPAAGAWSLPVIRFPEAKSVRGHLGVTAAAGYRLTTGTVDKLSELPLSQFPSQQHPLQQAYRLREADWTASMTVEALGQSIQADVFHLYSLKEGMVYGSILLNYFVVGAPVSEWRLSVPAEVGNVAIDGQDVQGWRQEANELLITLHQPALGPSTLLLTFEQPMAAEGGVLQPGTVTPLGVQGERGFIQIVSPYQVRQEITEASPGLARLEASELPTEFQLLTRAPSLAVYQYSARPFTLSMNINWFEPGETADQIIDYARLYSQIARDGQVVTEARFHVKTRGRQALRLRLPAQVSLWDAQVADKPVNARADGEYTVIPLEGSVDPNQLVEVLVRMGQAGQNPSRPSISAPSADAPIMISEWRVRSDHGRLLVPTGAAKAQVTNGQLTETGFQWLQRWWPGLIAVVALGLIGWCLLKGANGRIRPIFGNIAILLALLGSAFHVIAALRFRSVNAQSLEIMAPVVTPNQPLSLTLRHVPAWQAMLVWPGLIVAALGIVLFLLGRFVPKAPRGLLSGLGGVLVTFGLLSQHLGAALFFFALTIGLFLPFLLTGWRVWREHCRLHREAKAKAAHEATSETNATASALLVVGLAGSLLLASASESHAKEQPMLEAAITADQISQQWQIKKQRLFAEMTLTITGETGDWFPLLQAPAVLTKFEASDAGLRVTKRDREDAVDYWLVLETAGTFTASVTYEAAVPELQNLAIPTGNAAVHRLQVRYDQPGYRITSPAAMRSEVVEVAQGTSAAAFLLSPWGTMQIRIHPQSRDLASEDAQFYAEVHNLFVPRPGVVDGTHRIALRPSQGSVRDMEALIPAGFTVSDVRADNVSQWRFDPESRLLRVQFTAAIADQQTLTILTQQGTGSLPVQVTLQPVRVQGTAGEVGMLGLAFGPHAQADTITAQDLSAVNLEDFDASLLGHNTEGIAENDRLVLQRAYRYGETLGNLAVDVVPVQPEIRVTHRQTLSLGEERLVLAIDVLAAVKRAGVFQLRFPVPAELDIEAISGSHLDHWSEVTEGTQRVVVLHLKERSIGDLKFAISLAGPAPGPQAAWVVPRFTIEGASRMTGQLAITPDPGIRMQAVSRRNVSQLDVRQITRTQPGTLAYRLLQDDWELQLRVEKLDAWVTAKALQEVTLREGQTRTRLAIDYQIENAAVKTLRVSLPDLSDDDEKTVHAMGDAISDIVRVADQDDLWEIRFRRGMLGKLTAIINYQKPSDLSDNSETIAPASLVDVRQATHWLAVRGADRLDLSTNDPDRRWQAVDWSSVPRELQNSRTPGVPAISVRAVAPDQPLQVSVTRHEVAEALKLRVAGGTLTSILSSQGETATKAQLTIEVAERSPLRVRLPEGASLLNVFVNGQSVALVREDDAYLFHVFPKEDSPLADVSFAYVLYGKQSLRALTLSGPRLNIPLQNITWKVVLPNGYTLRQATGDLDLQDEGRAVRIDLGSYLSSQSQRRAQSIQDGKVLLEKANKWRQEGQQDKAREALYNASNGFLLDAASSEDARVQLRQLQTEQAVLGLNTRRQLLVTENRIESPQFSRNEQLEQATDLNPFLKGQTDYTPDEVDDLLQGNTVEENSALKSMASRLVSQQLASDPALRGIDVTLPAHGQLLTFQRSVQVDGNEALALKLAVAPSHRTPWWVSILVCAAVGVLAWLASSRFERATRQPT